MIKRTTLRIFQAAHKRYISLEDLDTVIEKHNLIATQNNFISTKNFKVKIDNIQQNWKYRLYGDREETINHIVIEHSKIAQKD